MVEKEALGDLMVGEASARWRDYPGLGITWNG